MSHLISHFKQSRITLFLALGLVFFTLGSVTLFAAAPNGGYTPGQTLDPDCAPGDTDCFVNPGVGGAVPTNGLQVVGGGIGLGGELTEAVTSIDAEIAATQTLAFGSNNSFENFYVGAGNIDVVGGNVIVDASNLVSILGQTISTNGQGEFRIGDINLSSLFGASFPGVATIYSYEHPSTADIYQMGVFHVEANAFGGIPVSQHLLANSTTGDTAYLRLIESSEMGVSLIVDDGNESGLIVSENGVGFKINDVNTFNIPTTAGTNGYVLATDGNGNTSWVAGGSGAAAGNDGEVQFNRLGLIEATSTVRVNPQGLLVLGSASTATSGGLLFENAGGSGSFLLNSSTPDTLTFGSENNNGVNLQTKNEDITISVGSGQGVLGADISLIAGQAPTAGGISGSITLKAGDSAGSYAGNVTIQSGASTGDLNFGSNIYFRSGNTDLVRIQGNGVTTFTSSTNQSMVSFTNLDGTCTLDPGDIGGLSCPSDENLKKNITTLDAALNAVLDLRAVTYHMRNESDTDQLKAGLIAQEVQTKIPSLVKTQSDGTLSLNYNGLIPYLVKAIQELHQKLDIVSGGITVGAQVGELVVDRIRARELCLDDLCIDRADLEHILEKTNTSGSIFTPAPTENETIDIVGTDDVAPTDTPTETSNDVSGDTASQGHTDTENPENTDPQAESSDDSQGQSEPATESVSEEPTTNADQSDTEAASEPVL